MAAPHVDLEEEVPGRYAVRAASFTGEVTFVLVLTDPQHTLGLAQDETTARAIVAFLLSRQDAADLPPEVELDAVVAAYPDAVGAIRTLRDSSGEVTTDRVES